MSKKELHSKLDRLRGHIVAKPAAPPPEVLPERCRVLAERLDGEAVCTARGGFVLIRKRFPPVYTHGEIALADFAARTDFPASAFTASDDPARLPVADLRFFDLETIGLGGAGTAAFLVGLGALVEGGFEVRQYLLPDYDDEAALLAAVAEEFSDRTVLVSYNGAAFDLPILLDRFTINRVGREIPRARHVDLLHAVRRLFRRRLRQCDLGNIERDVFGFRRFDDIPGYLVPSVYFDWLSDHKLDEMEKVLQHNRHDIVSLYFLAAVLAEVFESRGERLSEIDDLHSLARVFNRRRDFDLVVDLNRRVESLAGTPDPLADHPDPRADRAQPGGHPGARALPADVLFFHAQTHKRRGEYDEAVVIWKQLASSIPAPPATGPATGPASPPATGPAPPPATGPATGSSHLSFPRRREPRHTPTGASDLPIRHNLPADQTPSGPGLTSPADAGTLLRVAYRACLELAIHYEHRAKEFALALAYTRRAESLPDLNPSRRRSLQKRRDRLVRKQEA
ncbi:MAG TPA: ribonuclease H-like domain-containing protein [candidate division Zixibacteria bacterium]|nr:ribonuclease H-like domain-containing protein [candidate division Zixibacteria bacterium]MDD4916242.1 ribonuclease H-like domain-containing protein [candidate division Zixibacteria bacterium]MDM7972762.1 ribonuclease H-like domain-containing protein [candidate division Zixibacteria bacterium]HPI32052.1 ribonuclease H-like domain-containing protein [candidate division Zixibacteria bacterium]HPM37547.1 ribonuclease H-like domain-containing protein [candidate division Zixibacteria bacterium]